MDKRPGVKEQLARTDQMSDKSDPAGMKQSYERLLDLHDSKGLLTERLPFTRGLLEEVVFFTYKMRFITQGDVKRLLCLDRAGLKAMIHQWNSGDEGNCTCRLARNPFADPEE